MTHDEYLTRLETFTDLGEDAAAVLEHAGICALCRRDARAADQALARLEPGGRSPIEEVARWSAAAAVLVLVVLGFQKPVREPGRTVPASAPARYLVVGDASGVVAYTPEGVVVGVAPRARLSEKAVSNADPVAGRFGLVLGGRGL
jgi:hypothetical protein